MAQKTQPAYGVFHQQYGDFSLKGSAGFSNALIFDLRMSDRVPDESDGQAVDQTNLGAVHYYYDDMKNNEGNVVLPYG